MNEKVKKIVKWIAVIAAAIGAAAAVIMEQGCTHKHYLKANGIKIDTNIVTGKQQQKSSNMEKKFRDQLLTESKKREEELKDVNLEIEERAVSKKGPFVLIRNKNNKWVITTCGALVNEKEFDTKEDAEKHLSKKHGMTS